MTVRRLTQNTEEEKNILAEKSNVSTSFIFLKSFLFKSVIFQKENV